MGNFLENLKNNYNKHPLTNPLLNNSLSKLREYLGSFKSVCDTFSIDLNQYDNIFSSNETSFKIWDTDNNGFIDALELFSGLILFADQSFEDKVGFLFDIFDFNEQGILSLTDLQFMLIQSANATYKIYGMGFEVSEQDIANFLDNYFRDDTEITSNVLLKWCAKVSEIEQFMDFIQKKTPERKVISEASLINLDDLQENRYKDNKILLSQNIKSHQLGSILSDSSYKAQVDWLLGLCNRLFSLNNDNVKYSQDVYTKINWVYGIRCNKVNKPLKYQRWDHQKASSEKIIYFIGCIAVIYYPKLFEQQHYTEHDCEIISLALGKKSSLVATGELAERPSLHIWDSNTLTNLGVINGIHINGIHLLAFFKDDELIASCGIRDKSQILIYSVKDLQLILSTFVNEMAMEIVLIDNFLTDQPHKEKQQFKSEEEQQNQQTYMNVSMNKSKQQLDESNQKAEFFNTDNAFLVCTEFQIVLFHYYEGTFLTNEFQLDMFGITEPLICASCFKTKKQNDQQLDTQNKSNNNIQTEQDKNSQNVVLLITGHKNGSLVVWENFVFCEEIKYHEHDIVSITNFQYGVMVGTADGTIHLWDFFMKNPIKYYELKNMPFSLISHKIASLFGYQEKILVVTQEGDVINMNFDADQVLDDTQLFRNNFISKISGNMYGMCLLENEKIENDDDKILYIGGELGIVYAFQMETNQLIDMWKFDHCITAIDCIQYQEEEGLFFCVGLINGSVMIKYPRSQSFEELYQCGTQELKHPVSDLKFSSDAIYLIIACDDNCIQDQRENLYIFTLNQLGDHLEFKLKEKLALIDNEVPISIDFVDDNKAFLVGTSLKNQFKFDLPDLKKKNLMQEAEKINCSIWRIRYPLNLQNQSQKKEKEDLQAKNQINLPVVIGSDTKIFLAAGNSSYIYFWKDKSQLESNCGGFLKGHSSFIQKLTLSRIQNMFFSMGKTDNTVISWKIDSKHELDMPKINLAEGKINGTFQKSQQGYFQGMDRNENNQNQKEEDRKFEETENLQQAQQLVNKTLTKKNESNKIVEDSQQSQEAKIQQLQNLNDFALLRELLYSYLEFKGQYSKENLIDSYLLFRGVTDKKLQNIYKDFITKFDEEDYLQKRPPPLSIKLDYIYGFSCYDKRRTLFYVHMYYKKKQTKLSKQQQLQTKNQDSNNLQKQQLQQQLDQQQQQKSILIPSYFQKEMLFAKRSLLPYDEVHENCQRHFVYFVSRFGIVYNPLTNKQKFYEGHKNKISCLGVHPMKFIVATGEASNDPSIHIWNIMNCEPFKILKTHHKNGILQVQFSRDTSLLISLAIDQFYSIQITNWKSLEILAFRNTGPYQIFDMSFNPYNKYEFATCGIKNITFWEINGRNLLRKQIIPITEQYQTICCITCIAYISYSLGDKIESDIIAANNNGDLILVTCGKYIIAKDSAHSKMINCLKIIEFFQDKVLIITSGEDELIKIWDTRFNLINEISIRRNTPFFSDISDSVDLSAQSIDIFHCKYPKKNQESNSTGTKSQKNPASKNEKLISEENDDEDDNTNAMIYPILLVGTRHGDIFEASFSLEYTGLQKTTSLNNQLNQQKQLKSQDGRNFIDKNSSSDGSGSENEDILEDKIISQNDQLGQSDSFKFTYSIYIQFHSCQQQNNYKQINSKKVIFALHPKEKIIATTSEDRRVIFYDLSANKLLLMKGFEESAPSAIKFSPDGTILAIGFASGKLIIIEIFIKKLPQQQQKTDQIYQRPTIEVVQTIKEDIIKSGVINIEFSNSKEMFAASFDCERQTHNSYYSSFVSIYLMQRQIQQSQIQSFDKQNSNQNTIFYQKLFNIECPKLNNLENIHHIGVYFMNFTSDTRYILLYYQGVHENMQRQNNDNASFYQIWDLHKNEQSMNLELIRQAGMSSINFPNQLIANYNIYQNLILSEDGRGEYPMNTAQPVMTSMQKYQNYFLCGDQKGDLHFVKDSCLFVEQDALLLEKNENKKDKMWVLAKSYSAHTSFINQCELHNNGDIMFSTGINDECIIKWKFQEENQYWDYDNFRYNINEEIDEFQEVMTRDKFQTLIQQILPLRFDVAETYGATEDKKREQPCELQLINIIGRKAYSRHSNLFYDFQERFVYISGCNLVIHTVKEQEESDQNEGGENSINMYDKSNKSLNDNGQGKGTEEKKFDLEDENPLLHQDFIKLDDIASSSYAEISCFVISKDKKLICAGTSQINAKILVWDICSRTCLNQTTLTNSSHIQCVKFAYDNRHIICQSLTNEYTTMIYLIDTLNNVILACTNFPYTIPFKIKDMEMFPNSIHNFVTCGVQHLAVWSLKGSILSYCNMEIENPEDLVELKKEGEDKNDQDNLTVTFLTIIFVNETIITGGDDGFLYVWDNNKVIKKQNAHPKVAILSLHTTQFSNMFVSGGMDGKIIIWELGSSEYSYILEKFYEYDISFNQKLGQQLKDSPEKHIQSVCIGNKYILAGTKCGDIYELIRPDENELKSTTKVNQDLVKLRYNCHDQEIPRSIQFSGNSDILYVLSQKGLLSCWEIKTLKRIYTFHYMKDTHSIIVCKKTNQIILAFESEIIFIDANQHKYIINKKTLKIKSNISDIKLSYNEEMLAVALDPNQQENAKIEIYDLTHDETIFKLSHNLENLSTSLEFIDFSTDNFYLIYKDNFEEIAIIDISNEKKVNTNYMEFDIEWCTDGIKVSEKTKGVNTYYSDENKILNIQKLSDKCIAVTDEMGTIRLFGYPCQSAAGMGYLQCYTDHLNYVNQCVMSPDKKYLVTSSEQDRCILIWKIFRYDDDLEEEQVEEQDEYFQNQQKEHIQQIDKKDQQPFQQSQQIQ